MNTVEFGKRVALLRKNKNYTQGKLGELLNITPQAISKWELGDALPDTGILPLLASALSTSIDYLLLGKAPIEKLSPYDAEYRENEFYWGTDPSPLAEQIAQLCQDEERQTLLDIGSGEGRDAFYFAQRGFKVDALEISLPGIEKIKKISQKNHYPIRPLHADMIGYELQNTYNVIYSSGSLQFLPPLKRQVHFAQYKACTASGGFNAHLVFVEKPFIKTAPDWETNESFYRSGELAGYYADWLILHYDEQILPCSSAGTPHQHAVCSIIAKKVL